MASRTTISFPVKLKARMEACEEPMNWSQVAARAFEIRLAEIAFAKEGRAMKKTVFQLRLESLLNAESMENGSNTPDFMLADYLMGCLKAFNEAVQARDDWYNKGEGIEENPRKGRK